MRLVDSIVGNVVVPLSFVGVILGGMHYDAKQNRHVDDVLNRAISKADLNRDGMLQSRELSSMLKATGNKLSIPEVKDISIRVGNETSFSYANDRAYKPTLTISLNDLERYLATR